MKLKLVNCPQLPIFLFCKSILCYLYFNDAENLRVIDVKVNEQRGPNGIPKIQLKWILNSN